MKATRVREVRGVVFYPVRGVLRDAVAELFDISVKVSGDNVTYEDVKRITANDRKAACLTTKDGRFCFKNLRPGKYLLRIGHRDDPQFSAMHIMVIVDPNGRHSSSRELQVRLTLSY